MKHKTSNMQRVCVVLLLVVLLSAMIIPYIQVKAQPKSDLRHMLLVGDTGLELMGQDVENEIFHNHASGTVSGEGSATNNDYDQHKWIYPGANPFSQVNGDLDLLLSRNRPEQVAVVVWLGEKYVNTRIPGYEEWFDHDWLGRDGSARTHSPGEYSGVALGRALSGYDYYVLEKRTTSKFDPETVKWEDVQNVDEPGASIDSVPSDSVHIKYPDDGPAPEPVWEEHEWSTHEWVPHVSSPTDESLEPGETVPEYDYVEVKHTKKYIQYYKYWVEVKAHKRGYAEDWLEKEVPVYAVSVGPQSKALKDDDRNKANEGVNSLNSGMRGCLNGVQYLNIYDEIEKHNPYYRNEDMSVPGDSDAKPAGGTYYDSATNNWIFHMIWHTILMKTPVKYVPPEPLDFSFYAISSSLTTYMNSVLSSAAPETYADHQILDHAPGAGNAGAFLGYGDKKYGFQNLITTTSSAGSSVVSYDGLANMMTSGDSVYNDMMHYAQYGYLLRDLGLDQTGSVEVGGVGRWLPGGAIFLTYGFSSMTHTLFNGILDVLTVLNPFEFLNRASSISDEWKENMKLGNLDLTGSPMVDSAVVNVMDMIGEAYDGFQSIGFMVVIPVSMAILVASLLIFYKTQSASTRWSKIKKFMFRFAFICIGIPILGSLYASTLHQLRGMEFSTTVDTSQLVASTFVDFEAWVRDSRLSPSNIHDEPEYLMSDKGVVLEMNTNINAPLGQASDETYSQLRHTALNINRKSGVLPHLSMADLPEDELKWSSGYLTDVVNSWENKPQIVRSQDVIHETSQLIRRYISGSFYQASDWESDVLSTFTKYHSNMENSITGAKDEIGRLVSQEEMDKAAEIGGSVDVVLNGTLYELFDSTNESQDWLSRPVDVNSKMFVKTDTSEPLNGPASVDPPKTYNKWQHFNLMANGTLDASVSGSVIRYTDAISAVNKHPVNDIHPMDGSHRAYSPLCPCTSVGLSSLAMYNYLSTTFGDNNMTIYSNTNSASMITRDGHYAVNIIGDTGMSFLFGLNCFVVLGIATVLSLWYALGMMVSTVKRSLKVLMAIPGSMLGVLRSAVQVIQGVIAMILEVIMTIITYSLVMQMILIMIEMMDTPLRSMAASGITIGGRMANMFGFDLQVAADSPVIMAFGLAVVSVILMMLIAVLLKKASGFMRVYNSVMDYVWLKYICCSEVAYEIVRKEAEKPVRHNQMWQELVEMFAINSTQTLVVAK